MAKFHPSRLLRRLATNHHDTNAGHGAGFVDDDDRGHRDDSDKHSDNDDDDNHNHNFHTRSAPRLPSIAELRPPSSASPPSAPPLPPLSCRPRSRKSWALHRQRSRSTTHPPSQRPRPPVVVDDAAHVVRSEDNAVPSRRPSPAALDGKTPIASAEELPLPFHELKQEITPETERRATPVALDYAGEQQLVAVVPGSNPDRPRSCDITLTSSSDDTPSLKEPPAAGGSSCERSDGDHSQTQYDPTLSSRNLTISSERISERDFQQPSIRSVPSSAALSPMSSRMTMRKVWVKRPGASPTQVQFRDGDLVDDVRDVILRKYGNSLGRTFDSPDVTLNVVSRPEHGSSQRVERVLGPEEDMGRTLDACYPDGQKIEDALIINVPHRRLTPRPSPRVLQSHNYHAVDEYRPLENGTDYFPPMASFVPASIPQTAGSHESRSTHASHQALSIAPTEHINPRSMSVVNSGQVPPLPSPTAIGARRRPKFVRQPTSPTVMSHVIANATVAGPPSVTSHRNSLRPRVDSTTSDAQHSSGIPPAPPLPTPPAPEAPPTNRNSSTPPPIIPASSVVGHLHKSARPRRSRKSTPDRQKIRTQLNGSGLAAPMNPVFDGSVPPINVLIVEDNIINLRILEGLMKRLKVRWQTALNGKIAVDKWRLGGYHLVLMDIQMPVMTGLQATKEIRRLERANGIGVFSSSAPASPDERPGSGARNTSRASENSGGTTDRGNSSSPSKSHNPEDDKLPVANGLFKSPVIIVALTASSLQSDRHEALAVGCNDFLTKPVSFLWLERKVLEWGCMQALIDFEGWRRWREQAAREDAGKSDEVRRKERERDEKERARAEKMAKLQEKQAAKAKEEKERKKRLSLGLSEPSAGLGTGASAGASAGAVAAVNGGGSGNTSAANSTVGVSGEVSAPPTIAAES